MHYRRALPRPLTTIVLPVLLIAACGNADAAQPAPHGVAATVNGTTIPSDRYDHLVAATSAKFDAKGIGPNTTTDEGRTRARKIQTGALQELVDEQLLLAMAAGRHVSVEPAEVDSAIAEVTQTLGGQSALDQRLQKDYETTDDFRNLVRVNRLQFKLRQQDSGFDAAFKQAVSTAKVLAYVAPCDRQHDFPRCAGIS